MEMGLFRNVFNNTRYSVHLVVAFTDLNRFAQRLFFTKIFFLHRSTDYHALRFVECGSGIALQEFIGEYFQNAGVGTVAPFFIEDIVAIPNQEFGSPVRYELGRLFYFWNFLFDGPRQGRWSGGIR